MREVPVWVTPLAYMLGGCTGYAIGLFLVSVWSGGPL